MIFLVFACAAIGAVAWLTLSGQGFGGVRGSGRVVTESRPVRDFDALELAGIGAVALTQGDEEALTIEAEDNILPEIEAVVEGRRLTLGFKRGRRPAPRPTKPIRFSVTMKDVRGLAVSGAGAITAATLATDRLDLRVSGSGQIALDRLTAEDVTAGLSGSGNVVVAGQVGRQTLTISGSGSYQAAGLASRDTAVTISGAGGARVAAADTLVARISGVGSVEYTGDPRVTQQITGVGRLRRVG
jgi:hypothetical protein